MNGKSITIAERRSALKLPDPTVVTQKIVVCPLFPMSPISEILLASNSRQEKGCNYA